MVQAVRGERRDPFAEDSPDETAPAMAGDSEWVCVDCDARQVERCQTCPSCGGVVVALNDMRDADYDPLIGRKLGGRFTVVARLGAGSMGAVYRARQDGMHREVALKVLKPERAFDEGAKARFEREARATSALTSPHTVTVYDFGEDESTAQGPLLYLAMERLEGESLGQRLKRIGRIAPADAVHIVRQVLRSLAEAHDKGVVHRDLKPDNIFLHTVPTPHGTEEMVKVLDFGIAKILQPDLKVDSLETQAGTVFGTPRYMSPEQAQSKPLDGRSDLYTVGLILFQMVTGRHVFPDDDAVVVMARHIQSLPPRPREVAPDAGISRKLEALILRCLAKDPRRRPQTALELHEELELVLSDPAGEPAVDPFAQAAAETRPANASIGPVADVSQALPAPPGRSQGTSTAAIVAGFVVVLVGAVGLGIFLAQSRSSPPVVVEPASAPTKRVEKEDPADKVKEIAPQIATGDPDRPAPSASASAKPEPTSAKATAGKPRPPTPPAGTVAKKEEPPPPAPTVTAPPPPTTTTTATKKPGGYGKFD